MNIVESKGELLTQETGLAGIYEAIATAGRVCYASEKTSANEAFVDRLIKSKHYRPLEFGTVYLVFTTRGNWKKYRENPFSRVVEYPDNVSVYVTTNYRVLVENKWEEDLKFLSDRLPFHEARYTIKWECARSIADEARTHVGLSTLMQSTRYCTYSKAKFGNQLTFIKPSDSDQNPRLYRITRLFWKVAEIGYKWLIKAGAKAEQARRILPLDIKTVCVQCGYEKDWDNFFDQRLKGTTGVPHPDMKLLTSTIYGEYFATKSRVAQLKDNFYEN